MKAIKITDNVWWVGAIDWNLRNFHGYLTPSGSTYNAYLIIDEKIALIDTVKAPFARELIERISSVVPPEKIDYVISNHVEMDHAGALSAIRAITPSAQFIADKRAADDINRHFKAGWNFKTVKTGDSISLGKRSLVFTEMPMVHWPDSMATWCPEERILFPNDAFGQHMASDVRFDDECSWDIVREEAMKYYANILMPLSGPIGKALAVLSKLDINIIAPSHGLIWRKNVKEIISCYDGWVAGRTQKKAVVAYDTMWNSTEDMARQISEGLAETHVDTKLFNLKNADLSEIVKDILEARGLAVGSPTLNNGMLPTIGSLLTYLKGLKPKGKIGFAFGSHGWAGGGAAGVETELKGMGVEISRPVITTKYVPDRNELDACFEAGVSLGKRISAIL